MKKDDEILKRLDEIQREQEEQRKRVENLHIFVNGNMLAALDRIQLLLESSRVLADMIRRQRYPSQKKPMEEVRDWLLGHRAEQPGLYCPPVTGIAPPMPPDDEAPSGESLNDESLSDESPSDESLRSATE